MKKFIIPIFLFFSVTAFAQEEKINQLEIYKNLRCLVCQGQSIADSNSDFAATIKIVVQDQINQGKTKNEIYNFLISKYGEWIVYKPMFNTNNFLLWFLPYLVLVFGGLIIFFILRKNRYNKGN